MMGLFSGRIHIPRKADRLGLGDSIYQIMYFSSFLFLSHVVGSVGIDRFLHIILVEYIQKELINH